MSRVSMVDAYLNEFGTKYKQVMCRYFNQGKCTFGNRCLFAHSPAELRYHSQQNSKIILCLEWFHHGKCSLGNNHCMLYDTHKHIDDVKKYVFSPSSPYRNFKHGSKRRIFIREKPKKFQTQTSIVTLTEYKLAAATTRVMEEFEKYKNSSTTSDATVSTNSALDQKSAERESESEPVLFQADETTLQRPPLTLDLSLRPLSPVSSTPPSSSSPSSFSSSPISLQSPPPPPPPLPYPILSPPEEPFANMTEEQRAAMTMPDHLHTEQSEFARKLTEAQTKLDSETKSSIVVFHEQREEEEEVDDKKMNKDHEKDTLAHKKHQQQEYQGTKTQETQETLRISKRASKRMRQKRNKQREQPLHTHSRSVYTKATDYLCVKSIYPKAEMYRRKAALEGVATNNWNLAIRYLNKAIEIDKTFYLLYSKRSLCYLQLKEFDTALCDIQTCLDLEPRFAYGYSIESLIHRELRDYDNAIETIEHAIALEPDNSLYYRTKNEILEAESHFWSNTCRNAIHSSKQQEEEDQCDTQVETKQTLDTHSPRFKPMDDDTAIGAADSLPASTGKIPMRNTKAENERLIQAGYTYKQICHFWQLVSNIASVSHDIEQQAAAVFQAFKDPDFANMGIKVKDPLVLQLIQEMESVCQTYEHQLKTTTQSTVTGTTGMTSISITETTTTSHGCTADTDPKETKQHLVVLHSRQGSTNESVIKDEMKEPAKTTQEDEYHNVRMRLQRQQEEEERKTKWEKTVGLNMVGKCGKLNCIRMSRKIMEDQPFYQIQCSQGCFILYHKDCWKSVNRHRLYPQKTTCLTPGCNGVLQIISLFSSMGKLDRIVYQHQPMCDVSSTQETKNAQSNDITVSSSNSPKDNGTEWIKPWSRKQRRRRRPTSSSSSRPAQTRDKPRASQQVKEKLPMQSQSSSPPELSLVQELLDEKKPIAIQSDSVSATTLTSQVIETEHEHVSKPETKEETKTIVLPMECKIDATTKTIQKEMDEDDYHQLQTQIHQQLLLFLQFKSHEERHSKNVQDQKEPEFSLFSTPLCLQMTSRPREQDIEGYFPKETNIYPSPLGISIIHTDCAIAFPGLLSYPTELQ